MKALIAIVVFVTTASGFSGTVRGEEFYIVLDRTTQKCAIVNKAPATSTRTITLANDAIYKTRTEAESGMKTIKFCSETKNGTK